VKGCGTSAPAMHVPSKQALSAKLVIDIPWLAIFYCQKIGCRNTWDRCYDHNFLRFVTNFVEKIGVFFKNQCYDQIFLISFVFSQKNANFLPNFSAKIFKIS
jgi:hypothetical protein